MYFTYAQAQQIIEEKNSRVFSEADFSGKFPHEGVFKVDDMNEYHYTSYNYAGLDKPTERVMLESLAPTNYKEGDALEKTPTLYGQLLAVPKELIKALAQSGPRDSRVRARLATYEDFQRETKRTAYWRMDAECAAKLINGTSTATKYVGRTGKALFATNHVTLSNPSVTTSNLTANAALTETNVDDFITTLNSEVDDAGMPLPPPSDYTIWCAPGLGSDAWKVINTDKKVDTDFNTANRVYSMRNKIKVVEWKQLDLENGSAYTGWGVNSDRHSLMAMWWERPSQEKDSDITRNAIVYAVNSAFVTFHESPRGTVAALPS